MNNAKPQPNQQGFSGAGQSAGNSQKSGSAPQTPGKNTSLSKPSSDKETGESCGCGPGKSMSSKPNAA